MYGASSVRRIFPLTRRFAIASVAHTPHFCVTPYLNPCLTSSRAAGTSASANTAAAAAAAAPRTKTKRGRKKKATATNPIAATAPAAAVASNTPDASPKSAPSHSSSPPSLHSKHKSEHHSALAAYAAARAATTQPSTPSRAKRKQRASTSAATATPAAAVAATTSAERETHTDAAMEENDVRLAMRMLMMSHHARGFHAKRQGDAQVEKEREAYRAHHESRLRRLAQKDANAQRLLGEDGRSIGDGIVPMLSYTKSDTLVDAGLATRGRAGGGDGVWRALNPVGLAASQAVAVVSSEDGLSEDDYADFLAQTTSGEEGRLHKMMRCGESGGMTEMDEWKSATLATLCAPNLAVYDTDHDLRVPSADVVRQSTAASAAAENGVRQRRTSGEADATRAAAAGTAAGFSDARFGFNTQGEEEEFGADVPFSMATQLKQRLAEEEDPDYAVSMYTSDDNDSDDAGPLQL